MTGSSLAPIVIPIVATISLTAWLILVSSVGSRPRAGDHLAPGHGSADPVAADGQRQPHVCRAGQADPAGAGPSQDACTARCNPKDQAAVGASGHQPGPVTATTGD